MGLPDHPPYTSGTSGRQPQNLETVMRTKELNATLPFRFLATALFALTLTCDAEEPKLQVTMPDIPGADVVEQGQFESGIARLKQRLGAESRAEAGARQIALCGAYVLSGNLNQAIGHCERAAAQPYLAPLAYNNRGVLRVWQGDYEGAREDFERSQSGGYQSYQNVRLRKATRKIVKRNAEYSQHLWAASLRKADSLVVETKPQ